MPALGMAQDTGKLVSWIKSEGEEVKTGDVLFEVETDKSTMEVEAQADGFLTNITAQAGDDVPVGQVIALVSVTKDTTIVKESPPPTSALDERPDALPQGHNVIMPTLGMAQDTGKLVSWLKSLGDYVEAEDLLFEVETDKSTMEVEAGAEGYLAATLAKAGDNVPTGQSIAVITQAKPESLLESELDIAPKAPIETSIETPAPPEPSQSEQAASNVKARHKKQSRKILASPKAKRLALEGGFDLAQLRAMGLSEPFHAKDIEALRTQPPSTKILVNSTADATGFFELLNQPAVQKLDHPLERLLALYIACAFKLQGQEFVIEFAQSGRQFLVTSKQLSEVQIVEGKTADFNVHTHTDLTDDKTTGTPTLLANMRGTRFDFALSFQPYQLDKTKAFFGLSELCGRIEEPLRHLL